MLVFSSQSSGKAESRELLERITIETGKCVERPCIRGHRRRVSDVLDLIAAGANRDEILADYAFLEDDDIAASSSDPGYCVYRATQNRSMSSIGSLDGGPGSSCLGKSTLAGLVDHLPDKIAFAALDQFPRALPAKSRIGGLQPLG